MIKIKHIFTIIVILLIGLSSNTLYSQSIRIVRTDVDSTRFDFITAGYVFGFDVYVDGVDSFNGLSFDLEWDAPDYVKFSQWELGKLGPKSNAQLVSRIDQINKLGILTVGVGTGQILDSTTKAISKVIHLDFVLLQSAEHGGKVKFTFIKPAISYFISGTPKIIELKTSPIEFKIHSYVDVYPGDADNSHEVDHMDYVNVTLYMGVGGPETKNTRTFKRTYPSSYWIAQRCLAWDIEPATYADCDGNGEITIKDMLIVSYNLGKTTVGPPGIVHKDKEQIPSNIFQSANFPQNAIYIPVNISSQYDFYSATFNIKFKKDGIANKLIGVKNGDLFPAETDLIYFNKSDNTAQFFITNKQNTICKNKNGVIAYLVFAEDANIGNNEVIIDDASAISENGTIFNLNSLTSVNFVNFDINNLDKSKMNLNLKDNLVDINLPENQYIKLVQIQDLNGKTIRSLQIQNKLNHLGIDLTGLVPTVYFLSIQTEDGKFYVEPLLYFH
ncbi:MAG: hypothetical protein ACPL1A_05360 [Candidatus Kapaibacteriota bacterium]